MRGDGHKLLGLGMRGEGHTLLGLGMRGEGEKLPRTELRFKARVDPSMCQSETTSPGMGDN